MENTFILRLCLRYYAMCYNCKACLGIHVYTLYFVWSHGPFSIFFLFSFPYFLLMMMRLLLLFSTHSFDTYKVKEPL